MDGVPGRIGGQGHRERVGDGVADPVRVPRGMTSSPMSQVARLLGRAHPEIAPKTYAQWLDDQPSRSVIDGLAAAVRNGRGR